MVQCQADIFSAGDKRLLLTSPTVNDLFILPRVLSVRMELAMQRQRATCGNGKAAYFSCVYVA